MWYVIIVALMLLENKAHSVAPERMLKSASVPFAL
jgi:hypothetical protein